MTKSTIFSLVCGVVFGAGLVLSGMTDPAKVQAFLDVKDASLAFVMGSAVITCAALYAIARRRDPAPFVQTKRIDGRLVSGAAIFGIGWGLVGACPAPAIVALGTGALWSFVFVAAMVVGARAQHFGAALAKREIAVQQPPAVTGVGEPAQ